MGGGFANPHRGEVTLQLDGRTRILRPSFGAMVALEEVMGMTLPELTGAVFQNGTVTLSADKARQIVGVCLIAEPGDDLLTMLPNDGFVAVTKACSRLLVNMITGGAPASDDKPGEQAGG